jgi:myo-inositol-1(or 4)-monophosphatase
VVGAAPDLRPNDRSTTLPDRMKTMERLHNTTPVDPGELLALALSVVRPAAELAREMRTEGVSGITTKSTETDVVTAADQAVERQVRQALAAARPGDRVFGEEYGVGRSVEESDVRWILDPIDGTVNYLYGLPQYAVSLAAELRGEIVAGVVRNAATGQEWTATKGGGAFAGEPGQRRLTGSTETRLSQALVGTGFGYQPARRAHQAEVVAGLITDVRDIRRFGSAAIDLCLAAEGRLDAYFERYLNEWDHAAGGLIAREAGLLVTGLAGAAPGPDMVMAAPPALHEQLHRRLVELRA